MNRRTFNVLLAILLLVTPVIFTACGSGENRQPGTVPGDNLPVSWGNDKNIRWSYDIEGRGWSSPVIYGNRVFITTAYNETKPPVAEEDIAPPPPPPPPPADSTKSGAARSEGPPPPRVQTEDTTYKSEVYRLEVSCLDLRTGREMWKRVAYKGTPRTGSHRGNGYASETPVTDGKRVYAYFGMTGIYCYDMKGKLLWSNDLGAFKTLNGWGTGSSPVLYNDMVFLKIDNEVNSFMVALDANTGKEKWRASRDEKTTYGTPLIWKNNLRTELVATGKTARSYDPETGKLLWEMKMTGQMFIPTPVADEDHIYLGNSAGGSDEYGSLYSVRAGATGDITPDTISLKSDGVDWYLRATGTGNPSPVLHKGLIYLLAGNGKNLTCIDAVSGETVYNQVLEKVAACWATPWVYKDNIYITDEKGFTFIVKTGEQFELLSQNRLNDKFWASAALSTGAYVFKGAKKVWCVAAMP